VDTTKSPVSFQFPSANKTLDPGWQSILMHRQADVKQLEMLIELAQHRS
jgi:hypothetical protein